LVEAYRFPPPRSKTLQAGDPAAPGPATFALKLEVVGKRLQRYCSP
jgi:hypothetical protein